MTVAWHARIPMSICEDKCNEITDGKRGNPGENTSVTSLMLVY